MARIRIQDENREITDFAEMNAFLAPFGIWYEKWQVEGRLGANATNDEILATYAPEVERLKNLKETRFIPPPRDEGRAKKTEKEEAFIPPLQD